MADQREQILLAEWGQSEGHALMRRKVAELKDAYFHNLARELYANPEKLSEADLVNKRRFFDGVMWVLNKPIFELKALEAEFKRNPNEEQM